MKQGNLCVLCVYARDRKDIAGVYCTQGFKNEDGSCSLFKKYLTSQEKKELRNGRSKQNK